MRIDAALIVNADVSFGSYCSPAACIELLKINMALYSYSLLVGSTLIINTYFQALDGETELIVVFSMTSYIYIFLQTFQVWLLLTCDFNSLIIAALHLGFIIASL